MQLVNVMDIAQAQLLNTQTYTHDSLKTNQTKSDLLDRAIDIVTLLTEENKRLKMVYILHTTLSYYNNIVILFYLSIDVSK